MAAPTKKSPIYDLLASGNPIPANLISQLVNKKIMTLDYTNNKIKKNGKQGYTTWSDVYPEGTDYNQIKSDFMRSYNQGYVKNYQKPESQDGKDYDGLYTREVTIADAKAHFKEENPWGREDDLGITLTLDIGRDFQPENYIGGKYGKNASGEQTIGSCFKLFKLLEACDVRLMQESTNQESLEKTEELSEELAL